MSDQKGNGLVSDMINLGFPIGLGIISDLRKRETNNEQSAGMLGENFIVEVGLSVVPLGLLALSDLNTPVNESKKVKKNSK